MKNNFKIIDDSGDKKYFTIVPNYILNHSTHWDREVYIQMKKIAGEDGTCWASQKTLAKQCGVSINRLKESINYLLDHKWIKQIGKKGVMTKGGAQETNEYIISDLWKLNVEFYENKKGVSPDDIPTRKGVSQNKQRSVAADTKGVSQDDDKEEPINKNKEEIAGMNPAGPDIQFSFKEYLKELENDKARHINVIGHFFEEKGISFSTREQAKVGIRRHLRPAVEVAKFSDEEIVRATEEAKKQYKDFWTVETILKILTR